MTTKEHIYAIKNILSSGSISDDLNFSDKFVEHILNVVRGKLMEEKINKYHFVSEQSYQDYCAELEMSSFHECCGTDYKGCEVLKSTKPLPKFLNSRWGNFVKVTDLEGNVIPEIDINIIKYSQFSNTPVKVGYFISNNRVYIVGNKNLRKVLVNALFDNPEEVRRNNCNVNTIDCENSAQFPIDADLIAPLYELTLKYLTLGTIRDDSNDSKDQSREGK